MGLEGYLFGSVQLQTLLLLGMGCILILCFQYRDQLFVTPVAKQKLPLVSPVKTFFTTRIREKEDIDRGVS